MELTVSSLRKKKKLAIPLLNKAAYSAKLKGQKHLVRTTVLFLVSNISITKGSKY